MDFGLFMEFPVDDGAGDQDGFEEGFRLVDEAESMGVDSVWLAEYHFIPFSVLSSPMTVGAAIAARTKRMRIGFGVFLLPLGNPVRIAEEVATLDHISRGRVDFGIGRGTFPDHHDAFNSPYPESRGRFEEYLEIILQAWTNEQFSFAGEHYQCADLCVRPKPFQKPHPPVRVGITSAETFPIIGRMGFPIFINPSRVFALPELAPHIQQYREAWRAAGHPGDGQVGLRIPVYLAETAEQAYEEPRESALGSMQSLGERVGRFASRAGTPGNWQAESARILEMNYDDWLRDKVVYGTPEAVVDRLQQLIEELHLSQIVYEINYGRRIPFELQRSSLRLLTERVLPVFK